MESKGQMAIFYEGCRIIKLNEQVRAGTAAFFFPRERHSVTENGEDRRKNCSCEREEKRVIKGTETYCISEGLIDFFPSAAVQLFQTCCMLAGWGVGVGGQKKPAVVGSGWFFDFQGQFLVGWNKKDASEIPSFPVFPAIGAYRSIG